MSDQEIFRRVHRSDAVRAPYTREVSPARPLEPYDAFKVSLGLQEVLESAQPSIGDLDTFLNEPPSPEFSRSMPYRASDKCSPSHQCSERPQSAPSSPKSLWESCDGHHNSLPDRELSCDRHLFGTGRAGSEEPQSPSCFRDAQLLQGNLSDGEFLNNLRLSTREPFHAAPFEDDTLVSGCSSDGKFLDKNGQTLNVHKPRRRPPPLKRVKSYDSFDFLGMSSDGKLKYVDKQTTPQTPILKAANGYLSPISPLVESAGFPGSLSDGEFWNRQSCPERQSKNIPVPFATITGLRGGGNPSIGDDIEEMPAVEIGKRIAKLSEEIGTLNAELAHRDKFGHGSATSLPTSSPSRGSPIAWGRYDRRSTFDSVSETACPRPSRSSAARSIGPSDSCSRQHSVATSNSFLRAMSPATLFCHKCPRHCESSKQKDKAIDKEKAQELTPQTSHSASEQSGSTKQPAKSQLRGSSLSEKRQQSCEMASGRGGQYNTRRDRLLADIVMLEVSLLATWTPVRRMH